MRVFENLDEYAAAVGQELGVSDCFALDQNRVKQFADATGAAPLRAGISMPVPPGFQPVPSRQARAHPPSSDAQDKPTNNHAVIG